MNECLICGCTDNNCGQCVEKTGEPCYWIDDSKMLCSACSKEAAERIGFFNYIFRRLEKDPPEEIVRMLRLKKNEIAQIPNDQNVNEKLDVETIEWIKNFNFRQL